MNDTNKGETVENWREKSKKSKKSSKPKTKFEEIEIIFHNILSKKWKRNTKWFNIFRRILNISRNYSHKRNKDIK